MQGIIFFLEYFWW